MLRYTFLTGLLTVAVVATAPAQDAATPPSAAPPSVPQPTSPTSFSPFRTSSLALSLGWGAPYGFGLEYAYLVSSHVDVNAGAGLGLGGKIGVGARYYLTTERAFTPYVGANLVRSGGIDNVRLSVDNEETEYRLCPSGVLHLRGGLRWQPGHVGISGTVGQGLRLGGNPVEFSPNYPAPSVRLRNAARILSPGGLEVSVALHIGLGR
ncbi:hypothetical protein [Hymenobacter sp. B81]|uniref:hypothetical protein n=1 Tax=Hymenobacter sp. B81 TaxID=3344878 RepID=UPI0037DCCF3A